MAKIGLRNIKTALAVLICLIIYFVILLISYFINHSWIRSFKISTQLYTPFFACLATAYSISTNKEKSFAQGKLRLTASIIGGLFGMLIIAIYQAFGKDWPFQHISATGNPTTDHSGLFQTGWLAGKKFGVEDVNTEFVLSFIGPVFITMFAVVFVIWFCNQIKKPECSFISVLTLTAVMTSLGTNPIIYGPNRILSTIIGILVALAVNMVSLPKHKNKENLLVFGIDGVFTNENSTFAGLNQYMINKLVKDGANVTLFTTRTPGTLENIKGTTIINLPVICMSGAALYDYNSEKYLYVENISNDVSNKLNKLFDELNVNPVVSVIRDNLLYSYVTKSDNKALNTYVSNRKNAKYISFNTIDKAPLEDILYYLVVDKTEKIQELIEKINKTVGDKVVSLYYDMYEFNDVDSSYSYLKIYSKEIEKLHALDYFKNDNIYGFALHQNDYILSKNVKYSYTTEDACDMLKNNSKEVVKDNKTHTILLKKANDVYYKKKSI